jgi:hypothetical protein
LIVSSLASISGPFSISPFQSTPFPAGVFR